MNKIYEEAIKPMLPEKFDENEWFTIGILIIVSLCLYYIAIKNRTFLWTEIICISLLNLQLATIGDYFFAMPPYDFYDTVDKNSGELADIFLHNIIYPGTVLVLMHVYKAMQPRKLVFILATALLLSGLEAISVYMFHLFTYKSWKLYYSLFFYVMVMLGNVIFYEKLNMYIRKKLNNV